MYGCFCILFHPQTNQVMLIKTLLKCLFLSVLIGYQAMGQSVNPNPTWTISARVFNDGPAGSFDDRAVKDPSIVYADGRYHLFYTGRDQGTGGSWRMGYTSATSIETLNSGTRHYMGALNGGGYFCAPQVFWFGTKGKWFLIYQSGLGATFSTNTDVGNPSGWTPGRAMGFNDGIDFWCISDGTYVYCFYSSQDGSRSIKRRRTTIANFPYEWSAPTTVATNTFEAVHVYKNNADGQYYMVVEDIARHQELWRASNPGGTFTKISEQWAHSDDLVDLADHWTDQVSHVEVIRSGNNELLEVEDLNNCSMLFQGVLDGSYGGYGNIPYDLGVASNGNGSTCSTGSYGSGTPMRIVMRGTTGQEQVRVTVGGNQVASFTLCTTMSDYRCSSGSNSGQINVEFINDQGSRDVQIDYVSVDGDWRQAEDQTTNTGVWQNSSCGGSNSEWLHCGGFIAFGSTGGSSSSFVQLRNRSTSLFLDGMGLTTNGSACAQYGGTTHPNSQWELVDAGGGYYQLQNVGTGLFLDGMGRTTNGSYVGQYANTSSQNSHWALQQFDGIYYRVQNRATGLYLDGMGRTTNGSACGQYSGTSNSNAQWELVSASGSRVVDELNPIVETQSLMFYPNPVRDVLNFKMENDSKLSAIKISDVSGRLMMNIDAKNLEDQVNVSSLLKGIYVLEVIKESGTIRSRLIKE